MNEEKDKLSKNSIINKRVVLFYGIIFLISLIAGTFFNLILNDNDSKLISEYLVNFFTTIKNNDIDYFATFINTTCTNALYVVIIWFLTYTLIGVPIILVIYFFKVFILGFTLSALITNFKIKGILYSFIFLFPHTIINIFVILILSIISIYISLKMLEILKKKKINIGNMIKKHFLLLTIFLLITIITSLYEAILLPKVFNLLI